jgi:hypothetical protein
VSATESSVLGGRKVVIAADAGNGAANGLHDSLGLPVTAPVVAYRRGGGLPVSSPAR